MVILDFAVVNVALPSMQADLGLDQSDLQWVVITHGLTLGGVLLLGGRRGTLSLVTPSIASSSASPHGRTLHVPEHPGNEPAFVLLHGFPGYPHHSRTTESPGPDWLPWMLSASPRKRDSPGLGA